MGARKGCGHNPLLLYSPGKDSLRFETMGLIIRSSAIHAAGCYTTTPIADGTRIVEYTGPRISKDLADEKYQDSVVTYLFGLGDGSVVIEGHGTAMFINHSCDPNCETDEKQGRVWIKAIRHIQAGEELVYDYNLYDGDEDPATCNCGTDSCRKTMYSHDEIGRRDREGRKLAARKRAHRKPLKGNQKGLRENSPRTTKSASSPAGKPIRG
jgi:uncharacterized protein